MHLPMIYIGGNINYNQCAPIFIKSNKTKFLFPLIWYAFKNLFLTNFFKPNLIVDIKNLNEFEILGYFIYKIRDKRKRTYCVLNTNDGNYFIKTGKDVKNEKLNLSIVKVLIKNNFNPILPVKTHLLNKTYRLNFYKFHSNKASNNRFTLKESIKFTNTLNNYNTVHEISLNEYLIKINAKPSLLFSNKLKKLFDIVKSHKIKLGNIHGDLISNNIIRKESIINVLDWESYSENQPLLIDYIGALDWNIIKKTASNIFDSDKTLTFFDHDIISFLIITSINDFKKSWDLISVLDYE